MHSALRSVKAQYPSLRSYSLPSHITRTPSAIRCAQAVAGQNQPSEMDNKEHESKTGRDSMSSLGEGYATRSDEEGFGGIYGGNQYLSKDDEDKTVDGKNPEFDHNQGSEVKEEEKARHQKEG